MSISSPTGRSCTTSAVNSQRKTIKLDSLARLKPASREAQRQPGKDSQEQASSTTKITIDRINMKDADNQRVSFLLVGVRQPRTACA